MKKKKGVFKRLKFFKFLNPKNLEKEVHVYGYHFSWKTNALVNICSLLGIGAIAVIFKLLPIYFAITIVTVIIVLPIFILDIYKRMFEQKRFADVITYMEQILYSFEKSGKVVAALKETREIFETGQMRDMIDSAITYIEEGKIKTQKGVLQEALEIIEKPYECVKIHTVHELLISSEEYGGDTDNSIMLMLEDIEIWKRRGYRLQADKKKSHTDNIISIIVATILCAVALYVLNGMSALFPGATDVNIFKVGIIQVSSALFILFMLLVFWKSSSSLTSNWLNDEYLHEQQYILDSYDAVMNYDDAKEKKKSLIFAAPFLIAALPAFLFSYSWIGIICILIAIFMLFQHKIGYNLAKKSVNEEMYIALPQWLMEIALLLQNNNVQVSISKSIVGAPPVLQKELVSLMDRLRQNPDNLKSYTDFCRNFDIPETQSCMKMLHAISESGTGNAKVQINNLIQRVNEMQDMADQIQNESTAFKMKMIFSYPIIGATVKLLVDLTIGMVFMFQMLGSMGVGGI